MQILQFIYIELQQIQNSEDNRTLKKSLNGQKHMQKKITNHTSDLTHIVGTKE